MNFFCKEKEYSMWVAEMQLNESDIFCLNAEESLMVSKMLFSVTDM